MTWFPVYCVVGYCIRWP